MGGIGKVSFRIYGNDHMPPHFHVIGGGIDAQVTFNPVAIIHGDLPTDLRREVFAWAEANRDVLAAEWNTWNPHIPFA